MKQKLLLPMLLLVLFASVIATSDIIPARAQSYFYLVNMPYSGTVRYWAVNNDVNATGFGYIVTGNGMYLRSFSTYLRNNSALSGTLRAAVWFTNLTLVEKTSDFAANQLTGPTMLQFNFSATHILANGVQYYVGFIVSQVNGGTISQAWSTSVGNHYQMIPEIWLFGDPTLYQPFGTVLMTDTNGNGGSGGGETPTSFYYQLQVKGTTAPYLDWTPIPHYPNYVNLWQTQTYQVRGYVYINGEIQGSGAYYLLETPLDNASSVFAGSYSFIDTGTVANGQFSFTFSPRVGWNSSTVLYQGVALNVEISQMPPASNITSDAFYVIWWGTNTFMIPGGYPNYTPGGTPISPITPSPGNIDTGAWSAYMTSFVAFFVLLCCVGLPVLVLGSAGGVPGLMVGSIFGLGVGVIGGLIPMWFIFLVGVAIAVVFVMYQRSNTTTGG